MTQVTGGTLLDVSPRPWSQAWEEALYGPGGFFLRDRPLDHFRTAVANPLLAESVRALALRVDDALGRPDPFDLVDVGAGGGELLEALATGAPGRWRLTGVDLRPAPPGLRWSAAVPEVTGLLLAHEWLDNVPLDVVEDGRLVLVDRDGSESPGPPASADAPAWIDHWWPDASRVEVGVTRDRAWAGAVAQVRRGLAVAVDYGHLRTDRRTTLTGYRDGRQVPPVPDGRGDLTAHVALDACAAATGARLVRQADALAALGVSAALPSPTAAPYAVGLQRAAWARELLDPRGLGGFGWLVQEVELPAGRIGL